MKQQKVLIYSVEWHKLEYPALYDPSVSGMFIHSLIEMYGTHHWWWYAPTLLYLRHFEYISDRYMRTFNPMRTSPQTRNKRLK